MKLFGSLSELVSVLFRKNGFSVTARPNQATTYTANRDIQVPPGDADHVMVSANSTQTLTNKTIDGDDNTIQDLPVTAIKTVLGDADEVILRDASGVPTSAKIVNANVDAAAAIDATKIGNGDVDNTELSLLNGLSGSLVTATSTTTLTNKTIDGDDNTLQDIGIASLKTVLADADKVIRRDAAGAVISGNSLPNSSALITTDSTSTLSNKTLSSPELDTPLIDDYFDINEEAAPATPASGKIRVYAKTDKRLYKKDDTGVESGLGGGSGTGEINAILNPSGETATTGWAVTGTATITRQSSGGPLDPVIPTALRLDSGAANDVVRYDFTLPTGLENSKVKIEFFMAPEGGAADGEWKVEMRDQALTKEYSLSTDASGNSLLPNSSGKYTTTFDSDGTNTLRLQFVRVTGSNHLDVTNIIVGPGIQPQGAVIGEWIDAGATSISGSTSNPTKGTTTVDSMKYRRVGSDMELELNYRQTVAGSAGSGSYLINLPSGFSVDTSQLPGDDQYMNALGTWVGQDTVNNSKQIGVVVYDDTVGGISVVFNQDGGDITDIWNSGSHSNFAVATFRYSVKFIVPVAEWAGSGIVNLAQNDIEYASNSNNGDASDTTSFAYGPAGSLFPTGALTAARNKRVRFKSAIQPTDTFVLEVSSSDQPGVWVQMDSQTTIGAASVVEYQNQNSVIYGLGQLQAVSGSSTDLDVTFGQYRFNSSTYGAGTSSWADLTGNNYWRIRKVSGGQAIGFNNVSGGFAGLMPANLANLDDVAATRMGLKVYLADSTYNGGNTITIGGTAYTSTTRGVFMPYQMQDGSWRCRFNLVVVVNGDGNITVNGLIAKNVSGYIQNVPGHSPDGGSTNQNSYIDPNTSTITFNNSVGISGDHMSFTADIELESKPNWAY